MQYALWGRNFIFAVHSFVTHKKKNMSVCRCVCVEKSIKVVKLFFRLGKGQTKSECLYDADVNGMYRIPGCKLSLKQLYAQGCKMCYTYILII